MRGSLLFSAVTAGIVLTTAMAVPAYADDNDSVFIGVLDQHGIGYNSPNDAISAAKQVCGFLSQGGSITDATTEVANQSGLTPDQSGFFVGAATAAYCPNESP